MSSHRTTRETRSHGVEDEAPLFVRIRDGRVKLLGLLFRA